MLYVTAEVVRQIAILAQPVMPASVGEDAGQPRHSRRTRATSRRWAARTRIKPGTTLPAPVGVFPRYVEPTSGLNGSKPMLVDSHCHLDFPDFADDLDAIVARAGGRRASGASSPSRRG